VADEQRLAHALTILRQHLRQVQQAQQLSPADSVRLASALLSSVLADGRAAGVGESTLQALDREGEALAVTPGGIASLKSEASAELMAEIVREEAAEERPDTIVVGPRAVEQAPEVDDDESAFYELPPPLDDAEPIEAVLVGLELSPPESPAAGGLQASALRRHPRFVSRTEVRVAIAGRQDLEELWTRDIGSGGMFVATAAPPPLGTDLDIALQTPDGELHVQGRVVRVLDAATASASGAEPGVGVEFTDLTQGRQGKLVQFLDQVTQQLKSIAVGAGAGEDDWTRSVRRFLALVDASDYYAATELVPEVGDGDLASRIEQLASVFESGRSAGQAERSELAGGALAALECVRRNLTEPAHRLAYDYTHGHVRADERLAECAATGQSSDLLRSVWHQVFPEKLAVAEGLAERAVAASRSCDFGQACALIQQAIDLDPMNPALRATRARWEVFAALARSCRSDNLDVAALTSWAAERGISGGQLRSLWHTLQPERSSRAEQLARRALAAAWDRQFEVAITVGGEALQCDPFNENLRHVIGRWQKLR